MTWRSKSTLGRTPPSGSLTSVERPPAGERTSRQRGKNQPSRLLAAVCMVRSSRVSNVPRQEERDQRQEFQVGPESRNPQAGGVHLAMEPRSTAKVSRKNGE